MYLGLGSNVGDRLHYLEKAVEEVGAFSLVSSASSVYETEPIGMDSVQPFYNVALAIETELEPRTLFLRLKEIEEKLGRKPSTHLKDREIDIDILLYEGMTYKDTMVESPHPRMAQRCFVLEPLREIAADLVHPTSGKTIDELWRQCDVAKHVERTNYQLHLTH